MAKKEIDKKALNAEISKAMMNDFERVGMGFVTYWKLIACAAVGLAVLIAAICWAASYQRSSAKNAREALSGARTADELAAALASYGSSPAAPAARAALRVLPELPDERLAVLEPGLLQDVVHVHFHRAQGKVQL